MVIFATKDQIKFLQKYYTCSARMCFISCAVSYSTLVELSDTGYDVITVDHPDTIKIFDEHKNIYCNLHAKELGDLPNEKLPHVIKVWRDLTDRANSKERLVYAITVDSKSVQSLYAINALEIINDKSTGLYRLKLNPEVLPLTRERLQCYLYELDNWYKGSVYIKLEADKDDSNPEYAALLNNFVTVKALINDFRKHDTI